MLSRHEGFFLAELLLSLSAWLVMASVVLPITIHLIGQSVDLRRETEALHLLYDRLKSMKVQGHNYVEAEVTELNGVIYRFHNVETIDGMETEVCVDFDGNFREVKTKCVLAK